MAKMSWKSLLAAALILGACGDGGDAAQSGEMEGGDPAANPAATAGGEGGEGMPGGETTPAPSATPGMTAGGPTGATAPAGVTFSPQLDIDFSQMTQTESGLYLQDLTVGPGMIAQDSAVARAHYTGWLPDGSQFDSSHDRGEPIGVQVGVGQVIRGWDEGLVGMRVGGTRRLVIPPDMAYGAAGRPGIPPNSWLVFDIELVGMGQPGGGGEGS